MLGDQGPEQSSQTNGESLLGVDDETIATGLRTVPKDAFRTSAFINGRQQEEAKRASRLYGQVKSLMLLEGGDKNEKDDNAARD